MIVITTTTRICSMVFGFLLFTRATSDEVVSNIKLKEIPKTESTLGILPVIIGDTVKVSFFANMSLADKKNAIVRWNYRLTREPQLFSGFSSSKPCWSAAFNRHAQFARSNHSFALVLDTKFID